MRFVVPLLKRKLEPLQELALDGSDDYETMYETISESSDKDKEKKVQQSTVKASDHVTKIYACATMWHETTDEMVQVSFAVVRRRSRAVRRSDEREKKKKEQEDEEVEKKAYRVVHQVGPEFRPYC